MTFGLLDQWTYMMTSLNSPMEALEYSWDMNGMDGSSLHLSSFYLLSEDTLSCSTNHLIFIDGLESFAERYLYIDTLIEYKYNFAQEIQPEAWAQRIILHSDATIEPIIDLLNRMFSRTTICSDASYIRGMTVRFIDTMGILLNELQDIHLDHDYRAVVENNIIQVIRQLK